MQNEVYIEHLNVFSECLFGFFKRGTLTTRVKWLHGSGASGEGIQLKHTPRTELPLLNGVHQRVRTGLTTLISS